MKIHLQSIDTDAQHHSPSSSNPSLFTDPAITAGYQKETIVVGGGGGRLGHGVLQGKVEMRETTLLEIEKKRIREAIIAEEVARRRLLEAEVRKELLMEHEMAIRSGGRLKSPFMQPLPSPSGGHNLLEPAVGLEERLVMSINEKYGIGGHRREPVLLLEDSPQIEGLVEDKQGVTVLECNGESLSGRKSKSSPAASEASSQPDLDRPKKKIKQELWECAICKLSATSEVSFNQHLQGRRHRAKEADVLAHKTGSYVGLGVVPENPIMQPVNLTLTTINQTNSGEEKSETRKTLVDQTAVLNKISSTSKDGEKKRDDFVFWCEMCQVGAFFEVVMEEHKRGKKHLSRLELYRKSKVNCADSSAENACDTEDKTEE